MSQQELVRKVIHALERAGIPYMITGAVASSLQGEPRTTHDIDIVVSLQQHQVNKLLDYFPSPHFYLDKNSIDDALQNKSMFNLIDVNGGDKVDFWILTEEQFDQSRFARKYSEEILGTRMYVSSPEDTILAKLRWAKLSGGSEKQFTDALRVYEVQHGKLDIAYLNDWVKKLNLESLWKRLQDEAEVS